MKRYGSVLLALIAVTILSALSSAETVHYGYDGYFCISKGYVAFDYLEDNVTAGRVVKATHLLKIVRFGPRHSIYFAGEVNLPATLAIRWMNCNAERVEVVGPVRDYAPFTKCVVKIAFSPTDVGPAECADNSASGETHGRDFPSFQILAEDAPPPLSLESPDDPDHRYQLLRHLSKKALTDGWEWRSQAEVVQLNDNGAILKRLLVYEYRRTEMAD